MKKGAEDYSLNQGISLNQGSLNQVLGLQITFKMDFGFPDVTFFF